MDGMPSCRWEVRSIAFSCHEFLPATHCLPSNLPLDANFDIRSQAAHRFWLALEGRPLGLLLFLCLSSGVGGSYWPCARSMGGWRETAIAK